ncbi:hypothetical protein BJY24_001881 [Nocardia transvalensis]|uniref:Secreted protein n=1 Tax=Nocardia transvalensis TaxID=37333 RepID=A0A7W9PBH6_9NOCA|nr:hypothetical protein [Nocardia transvalensis]MBB5913014.1 hypothetical protein [Nocardia transvalensis]
MFRRVPRTPFTLLTIGAVVTAGLALGAGSAAAQTLTSMPTPARACLWDGGAHAQGSSVVAGGRTYVCGADGHGAPFWAAGASTGAQDTVANPGSRADPAGRFSAGARQPGTGYNDYCVGHQLIAGTEDVYQVVRAADGRLFWKATAPAASWRFDTGTARPEPTWRTPAVCFDGSLV